jgi:4-hydroxy-tetrahydrodipicolinate reductase
MRIALIGYGKMGQTIEQIALKRGHEVVLKINSQNPHVLKDANLRNTDVAIEFTHPEAARENVLSCLRAKVPVVCGTTGWNEGLDHAKMTAIDFHTSFLHASNFSVGVNIFFEVNKFLARIMKDYEEYDVVLEETHHTQKKDAPSGTAITLAEQVINHIQRKKHWTSEQTGDSDSFPIIAHREENVPGTHHVKYISEIDDIEIIHTAHNRQGFAMGAVLAAEYIAGKTGVFTMKDVLGLNLKS